MYIQCMFEYILSSVVLITAKSCICEIKKHVTYEMLIRVVGSSINIMNKQTSFFSLRNENTFSECIFSAVTSKVISGLKKIIQINVLFFLLGTYSCCLSICILPIQMYTVIEWGSNLCI